MEKKQLNQEIEENEELEENEEIEENEESDGDEPPKKAKVKTSLFPKKLPSSEPPPEPKQKTNELDSVSAKIDELAQKVDSILNPLKPEPKKRDYQLFDEFDPTLESEA